MEPTLVPYRHKGPILAPVVRRNSHYRFGDSAGSIPQDPWAKNFKFLSFFNFTLVFKNLMLDLFKYALFPILVSAEASARPSQVIPTPVPVIVN